MTQEVACDLEAHGVLCVLVNSASEALKLGVKAITEGQTPPEATGALIVLAVATVVVAVVLVVVTTLSEAVVTTASLGLTEADAEAEGLSSSLSLMVMTSGTEVIVALRD